MIYCKKCGLPESYKGIAIGTDGTCSFCKFYEERKERLTDFEALESYFRSRTEAAREEAKRRGSRYDCIVGLSGGKDSTYIIYQLQKEYGMRVLAFTLDNGFSTDYGKNNIENALQRLNVDHIRIAVREETLRELYTKSMRLLHNVCGVCFHLMHYYAFLLAEQNRIPLIVNGRTRGQVLQNAAAEKGIEPFEISHSLGEFEYQMFGRLVDKLDGSSCLDLLHDARAEALSYFMYHKVREEETMELLERELGWKRPENRVPHADCWVHPIAEKLHLEKFGYPVRTGELAVLVREGDLTCREACALRESDKAAYDKEAEEVLHRFQSRIAMGSDRNVRG